MSDTQDNKIRPPYGPPRRVVQSPPMPEPDAQMPGMPQGPMLPPRTWQQRFLLNYGTSTRTMLQREEYTVPNWLVGKSVLFYFISYIVCTLVFGYAMPIRLAALSGFSVVLFFYGAHYMALKWRKMNESGFIKRVFLFGLLLRLIWVLYSYLVFNEDIYGKLDGFGDDNGWYMDFAQGIVKWLQDGMKVPFSTVQKIYDGATDDTGYPFLLAIEYILCLGYSDVLFPCIVKAFLNAYCVVCIYNIARRHFGNGTARMAALFMCLNPCMLFWCTCLLKEAEMVFICCMSVDKFDQVLMSKGKLTFRGLLPGIAYASLLFFFRTALALVLFLAVMAHIVLASRKVISYGKKIIAGVLVAATLFIGMGDRIRVQSEELLDMVRSGHQQNNMEWRSEREGGNDFAKYAGAAVFAPLIFTIPFPTFNMANETHLMQMEQAGGYYIKNIFSFFVIVVMILMVLSGDWRKHVFILSYTCGYLVVLVFSQFAQSGRFHMPIVPFLMLFAAYGIQLAKNNKRLQRGFTLVLIAEIAISLFWNWFKLAGRGLV